MFSVPISIGEESYHVDLPHHFLLCPGHPDYIINAANGTCVCGANVCDKAESGHFINVLKCEYFEIIWTAIATLFVALSNGKFSVYFFFPFDLAQSNFRSHH